MIITHKIQMDLIRRGIVPRLQAVQGDALTRQVQINLLADGRPWPIPGTPTVLIRYCRPDRVAGEYDTLADGMPAGSTDGTTVTITLAREVLAVPGDVVLVVTLVEGGRELSTFEFLVAVQPNHSQNIFQDANGASVTGMVPAPDSAQPGQILVIEDVDEYGQIRRVKAEEAPSGTTIVQIALDEDQPDDHATRYKILMSDGSAHTFTVSHGKSAYDYAQEAGYTRSEQDFAQKLADETPPALYITADYGEGDASGTTFPIVADATFADIYSAVQAGRGVYMVSPVGIFSFSGMDVDNSLAVFRLTVCEPGMVGFVSAFIGADGTGITSIDHIISGTLPGLTIGTMQYDGSESVNMTNEISNMIYARLPASLQNPCALTFTGAVNCSYDGSEAKTVNIPAVPSTLPNPNKLILTGAVSAEYDGSAAVTVEIPAGGGAGSDTELVLSDNLLDKSLLTRGQCFYYGGSGYQLVTAADTYYGFVPLQGAGTYRTKFQASVHSSTAKRIALVNDNNEWVINVIGVHGDIPSDDTRNWLDFEFVVTQSHIDAGATKIAFDVWVQYLDQTMLVKDREYPSEYIPYGYIEVATDSGKKQDNVLCGKTAIFLGDSICAGTTVGTDSPYYNYGWGGLIGEENHMNWKNYGKNGGTITHRGSDTTCIATIADTAIAEHPSADYVIFEGGANDADQMREDGLGDISADYATFDTTTFSGALESLISKLVTAYPHGKIGYIIPQKMYTGYADYTAENHIHRLYFDRALEICRKWGIPVIDIWNTTPLNPKLSTASVYYVEENGQHLTEAGYRRITPGIESWMRTL